MANETRVESCGETPRKTTLTSPLNSRTTSVTPTAPKATQATAIWILVFRLTLLLRGFKAQPLAPAGCRSLLDRSTGQCRCHPRFPPQRQGDSEFLLASFRTRQGRWSLSKRTLCASHFVRESGGFCLKERFIELI